MRRFSMMILLLGLMFAARDAKAFRLGGPTVVLPVVGRFAGVNGTQWRTDVFLGNPYTPAATVTLRFYPTGSAVQTRTVTVGAFSSMTLHDVVLNNFGMTSAAGVLEVSNEFTIDVRARIYNAGNPAGQFGQNVPGISKTLLNRQAYMYGLSGINGNRVNAGVANPNDTAVQVNVIISNQNNGSLHIGTVNVPAHGYVQYNDIFTTFSITPQEGVTVQFTTFDTNIYGYASEVRNDTGDAIFVFGLSPNS